MIESPMSLVGAERSGTTLLLLMLDHHPKIAFLPEFQFTVDLVGNDGRWPPVRESHAWLETSRASQDYDLEIDPDLDYPRLVDGFLGQKRDRDGKPIVGATVHHHFDRRLQLWPEARFVHLVPDGWDVAAFAIGMGWPSNTWTGTERGIVAERLWDSLRSRLAGRTIEVRHEELVS